ncbi:probable leucine-rich repeat receptor-like protein kinase At5g63930 [Selaginella moellendorffii]|uniref:probable leucine-rich repeat receptor-like protein kinase At5g63930 n=1 Tax=Selaginella moellendorffii TaxID=88036 RepID=UPI000D1D049A|nr:probable leucine-rich repeat receptor-like protein kinase At5g63930 [Selaginella moellendorffii]|eukprot:XP_024515168.1 probable leucine-rich repeat receptor-like protein kinase At5g63930 [Selaginella moellendorffii]
MAVRELIHYLRGVEFSLGETNAMSATIFLRVFLALGSIASVCCVRSSDLQILHSFSQQLVDSNASLTSWKLESPCSSWEGVLCRDDGVTVTAVLLYNKFLTGQISPSLGHLKFLQRLDLSQNGLSGHIPVELLKLTELTMLSLSSNQLSGEIPRHMEMLENLEYLYLSRNNLSGSIPRSLGSCRRLKELDVSGNYLEGNVPVELGQLRRLEKLGVAMNNLSGGIPDFTNCTNLTDLALSFNNLAGNVHPSVATLPRLQNLWLNDNQLSGDLPVKLGRHSNLLVLYLSSNRFTGTIPEDLCVNGFLERVYLHDNNLQGEIPPKLLTCPKLERLLLQNNMLTGQVPEEVGQNQVLNYLDLSNNRLNGSLPASLNDCKNLTTLFLACNRISGDLISGFEQLRQLNLSHNRLTGLIPRHFGGSDIFTLDLSHNSLHGEIPPDMQILQRLEKLFLDGNQLEGTIPRFIGTFSKLLALVLNNNKFTGSIPGDLGGLHSLRRLDLSSNRLSGTIPARLENLRMLEDLDLSANNLEGNIPSQLERLTSLEHLNVSYNNHLLAPIPSASSKFNSSSFLGLRNRNTTELACAINCKHKNKLSTTGKAAIACGVVFICVALASIVACWIWRRRNKRRGTDDRGRTLLLEKIMQVTNGLNQEFIIGQGGYGTVYRAEMESGKVLAIKKLTIAAEDSLMHEWETAGKVRHRNILKVLGHYRHGGSALLVSNFMTNGSLGSLLHGRCSNEKISWQLRYEIALGIAHGLSYLHHDCVPKIIHRDIKANNILLDKDMVPKIADFGLAKLIEKEAETKSMSYIAGSYGYIAPEYAFTLKVNEKSDIYSFGVILLELLLRKTPLDPLFSETDGNMTVWVRNETRGSSTGLESVADPEMWREASRIEKKEMERVFQIALLCTKGNPADRPTMQQIVEMLRTTPIHT